MIERTPRERRQYEARLKAQRDERARMQYAVEQARLEGEARSEARGKIKVLRDLLGLPAESLDDMTLEQLVALASDLQRQLPHRNV